MDSSRQCFIQQKNRHFVYSLIVTEKKAQLFHFDRSRVFHTIKINIHEEPAAFVRIVLGICSPDDKVVGFNTRSSGTRISVTSGLLMKTKRKSHILC